MAGLPSSISFLIVALVAIPSGIALKCWYGCDAGRSLFLLCLILAFVSPWLALAAFVAVRVPGILFQRGPRTQGN